MKKARICEKCKTINPYHVPSCQRCNSLLQYIDIKDAAEYTDEDFYPAKPNNYNDAWLTLKKEGTAYPEIEWTKPEKKSSPWLTVLWVSLAILVSFFLYCADQLGQIGN